MSECAVESCCVSPLPPLHSSNDCELREITNATMARATLMNIKKVALTLPSNLPMAKARFMHMNDPPQALFGNLPIARREL